MDKVEKFKELLQEHTYTSERIGRCTTRIELEIEITRQEKTEKELLKLYKEALNEKL